MKTIKVGRYVIELSHEDKILFPKSGITKEDLAHYYERIGPIMFPYVKNRLDSMQRFVHDITQESFFQKDAPDYFPDWITRKPIAREDGKMVHYVVLDKRATLVYLANQGCITPHVWLSRADKLHYPDRMIFDLDPSGSATFTDVRKIALLFKQQLEQCGLVPFAMTTGSRGIHVVVPLSRKQDFDYVRTFARDVCKVITALAPKITTLEMRKDARGNCIFLDYLRNGFGATGAAPYSVRPKEHAPVATPLHWKEVEDPKLTAQSYTITTIFDKLKRDGDPWKDINKSAKSLLQARKKLDALLAL